MLNSPLFLETINIPYLSRYKYEIQYLIFVLFLFTGGLLRARVLFCTATPNKMELFGEYEY